MGAVDSAAVKPERMFRKISVNGEGIGGFGETHPATGGILEGYRHKISRTGNILGRPML